MCIWPNFGKINLKISAAPVTNFKSIFKLGGKFNICGLAHSSSQPLQLCMNTKATSSFHNTTVYEHNSTL